MSTKGEGPLFVSAEASRAVFDWNDAVHAIQAAYAKPVQMGSIPHRTIAQSQGAWLRTLPAAPIDGRYLGAKLMSMSVTADEPGVEYVIVLFDRQTSRIAAFLDASFVTAFRTAATSAAALDRLVSQKTRRLAVLGSGLEAAMHVRAFASIRGFDEIVVFSPSHSRREDFAAAVAQDTGISAKAVTSGQAAVENADVVLAAARSHGELPILIGDWLSSGACVVSIGSTIPQQREIDASVVDRADLVVCDVLEEVVEETGDMIAAQAAGIDVISKSISLHELLSNATGAMSETPSIRLFKSVGSGLQDIVIAEMILTRAMAAGLATPLPISFQTKI